MIKESISKKLSHEDLDLVKKWKHNSSLYDKIKKEKSFFLKIELPGYKISEVVSEDVEDIIVGSTLESFSKIVKDLKKEMGNLEYTTEKQEVLIGNLESDIKKLQQELINKKSELESCKCFKFWRRLFNK